MKQNRKLIIWGVIILVVWYYLKIANAAVNLGYSKGRMYDFNFSLKDGFVTWVQGVNVINGDWIGIPIRSAGVLVKTGTTEVGYAILEEPFMIAGSTISELKLRVIIPIQNLFKLGQGLWSQVQAGKISASMTGTINSIGVTYPLNEHFTLDWSKDGNK